jgi:hypothetical protein
VPCCMVHEIACVACGDTRERPSIKLVTANASTATIWDMPGDTAKDRSLANSTPSGTGRGMAL